MYAIRSYYGNGRPWSLLFEDNLGLLVELGTFCHIGHDLCFLDQILKRLIAPLGTVGAANSVTTEKGGEEVVRISYNFV